VIGIKARNTKTATKKITRRGFRVYNDGQMTLQQQLETGLFHHQAGRLAEAERIYRQVLAQQPNHADVLHLLGTLVGQNGESEQAVKLLRQAIAIHPASAFYYGSLGNVLEDLGQLDEAISALRTAIQLKPDLAEAHNNLGNLLRNAGRVDEAVESFRQAIRLRPDKTSSHSNLLAVLHYHPDYDAAMIQAEHARWNQRHAEPLKTQIKPHNNDRDPGRRLKVGYVSADFCRHPVGLFMVPLLAHHDRGCVEVFCYSGVRAPDEITVKLRQSAHVWRDAAELSDEQLAAQIRDDRIDILVDLSLHTAGNRLLVFARKPAPVQVTWLGYPGTTGLTAMDYRLTDPQLDPPGENEWYSEKSVRLPRTFWCYEPIQPTLQVNSLPAAEAGHVTFGSLNNFAKVTSAALDLWAGILSAVGRSRLAIHSPPGAHRAGLIERFRRLGIDPSRLEFLARTSLLDYLQQYHRIDVALDPFPCGGGTTTCDALWMGVPTVTLRGRTAVGRMGVSILSNVGLHDWIAETPEQYVSIAVRMAGDLTKLAELRSELRKKMERSPLMNAKLFAADMEGAYRQMWKTWCSTAG
jgi:protein O-GlcNAc transferase